MAIEYFRLSDEAVAGLASLVGHQVNTLLARSIVVEHGGAITTDVDGWFSLAIPKTRNVNQPPFVYLNLANSLRDVDRLWDVPCFQLSIEETPKEIAVEFRESELVLSGLCSIVHVQGFSAISAIQVFETDWSDEGTGAVFDSGIKFLLENGNSFAFTIDTSIMCDVAFAQSPDLIDKALAGSALRLTITG